MNTEQIQHSAMIKILRGTDGPVKSEQLEQRLGLDRAGVFAVVTDLMTSGEPIYFENQSEMLPMGPLVYRYAQTPEELYETRVAVRDEAERFRDLQNGIEDAQISFHPHLQSLPDYPVLHTVYAVGVIDSAEFVMHFTRSGEKRECTYRGFPGIDKGRDNAKLLDRCFESWEAGQLMHHLVQCEDPEIGPCMVVPIWSVDQARAHIEQKKDGDGASVVIDLPIECGGPFEALGQQISTLPDSPALDSLRSLLGLVPK